jgi:hypothetical protein
MIAFEEYSRMENEELWQIIETISGIGLKIKTVTPHMGRVEIVIDVPLLTSTMK